MAPYTDLFEKYLQPLFPIPTTLSPSGQAREPVEAILFDVYGTLFISSSGDIDASERRAGPSGALQELIRSYDLKRAPETLLKSFYGAIRAEHIQRNTAGIDYPEVRVEQIWKKLLGFGDDEAARRFALAFELIVNPVWPMPHLALLLNACRNTGRVMGIVSNAQFFTPLLFDFFCNASPEELGFAPDLLVYSFAHGRAKPSPVLFDQAVKSLHKRRIAPENTLFVGNDMRNDIRAAHAAGLQTALFAGDARSLRLRADAPCCTGLVPDLCITGLEQLPARIGIPFSRSGLPADPD